MGSIVCLATPEIQDEVLQFETDLYGIFYVCVDDKLNKSSQATAQIYNVLRFRESIYSFLYGVRRVPNLEFYASRVIHNIDCRT